MIFRFRIIETNGGIPPLTFKTFVAVADVLGSPENPHGPPDYKNVELPLCENFEEKFELPSLEELGVTSEFEEQEDFPNHWIGGESQGLKLLEERIVIEADVNILNTPP